MAPTTTSARRRSEKTQKMSPTLTRRIITRSIYKKEQLLLSQQQQQQQQTPEKTAATNEDKYVESPSSFINGDDHSLYNNRDVCTTPKSEKFKIPEIRTCPPAPKKPRNNNCLIQKRRPITFFAHPDLEKFFMFATPMRDIKV